jgi:hypothetical protein
MCPDCGSSNVHVEPYDYGFCRETGYHDAGELYACQDCGATGDADDLAMQSSRHSDVESIGTFWAGGGALPSSPVFLALGRLRGGHSGQWRRSVPNHHAGRRASARHDDACPRPAASGPAPEPRRPANAGDVEPGHHRVGWRLQLRAANREHPTMKPVELVERALHNNSKSRDTILDPFGGSGTTVIACERTGRLARVIELDPKYCDVIVRRWEAFTSQHARRDV